MSDTVEDAVLIGAMYQSFRYGSRTARVYAHEGKDIPDILLPGRMTERAVKINPRILDRERLNAVAPWRLTYALSFLETETNTWLFKEFDRRLLRSRKYRG